MSLIIAFVAILLVSIGTIPWVGPKTKGKVAMVAVFLLAVVSSMPALDALRGNLFTVTLSGSIVTGPIRVEVDALSAWFILVINFTFITGVLYGFHYMNAYLKQRSELALHWVCFLLVQSALICICSLQNSIAFLIAWEVMAVSAFVLVIFEHGKAETLKAGVNYLIQSHISIIFITLGFIWVASSSNTFDFISIRQFSLQYPLVASLALFLCLSIGFAIKAGFVPFHTWLPYAHPAAPSHVSGVMSGVIIKIGIYGILRMVLLIKTDYTVLGYIILTVSVISGVYGVMLAIVQHNLKKLLAYHSIENIGIIGIGIGMGCIGLGSGNQLLILLGFSGALLHTLNHSLFKSLLFFCAGNVYQATHIISIDQLGGLGKRMPHTSALFLIAALAICGLPPFNGFVSEFIIYSGMFKGMKGAGLSELFMLVFSVFGLTLIGGLALLCFTKAFGVIFMGTPRTTFEHAHGEAVMGKLAPMYAIVIIIMLIGALPQYAIQLLREPVGLFTKYPVYGLSFMSFPFTETITWVGAGALSLISLSALVFALRKWVTSKAKEAYRPTWGCGYVAPTAKLQYTASSFVRSYAKLAEPILSVYKHKKEVDGVFPTEASHVTHSEDKIEEWVIAYPIDRLKRFLNRFTFLQNGNPQIYVLYGLLFIALILLVPIVLESLQLLFMFLNHL